MIEISVRDVEDKVLGRLDLTGTTWIQSGGGFKNLERIDVPAKRDGIPCFIVLHFRGREVRSEWMGGPVSEGDAICFISGALSIEAFMEIPL
jgi:hypothetical protein